jgi:rhamnose transport system ATP-binding protein
VAQRHLVQIARALSNDARIIIMDEPTAALSHREAEELFAITRRLRDEGRAILFISHKFEEIFRLCDRYAVFRDGAGVGQGELSGVTDGELVRLMVGRQVEQIFPKTSVPIGDEVLRVEGLGRMNEFADVSFNVRSGEILGVYGLVGAGRSEVMQALFGIAPVETGRIVLDGQEVRIRTATDAIRRGIALVPEDRQNQGAHLKLSIAENITLPDIGRYGRPFLSGSRERAEGERQAQALGIKMAGLDQKVEELSGGNQQKVVIGKWMATRPRLLILDEPTKGIDVGAKAQVHRLMGELVAAGVAVIMVSSELPEVMGMADRVLVMRRGRVRGILDRADATAEAIVRLATDA